MSAELRVTAATGVLGVIGDPVSHSLSPVLHNAAYRALGLDLCYGAFAVRASELPAAMLGARALGLVGLSVTTPHKDGVVRLCDQRSKLVERLGAANTVVFRDGISFAESTDGKGLIDDLAQALGFDPAGEICAVLGAGGAGRAVVASLTDSGAREVLIWNRTHERAEQALALTGGVGRVIDSEELSSARLVVNATSIGLGAQTADTDELVARLIQPFHPGQIVVDLVYRPARTAFLSGAAKAGATTRNGLGMLVHQAGGQVELFTGGPAPIEAMWEAVRAEGLAEAN